MMNNRDRYMTLRSKKIGLILLGVRESHHTTYSDCANAMGVSEDRYRSYENGEACPSLPELEGLAFLYHIPVESFLGAQLIQSPANFLDADSRTKLLVIRNKKVAVLIRKAREHLNLDYAALSTQVSIPGIILEKYEHNELPVPLADLELLTQVLHLPIEDLFDRSSPIGTWRRQNELQNHLQTLPSELLEFICQPVNRPYLELAKRLSELSVERLRSVAEGLLEITY